MERAFQVCFFVGTLFTIVSFALGSVFGSEDAEVDFDTDTDLDFDVDTDVDVDVGEESDLGDFSVGRIVALKPSTLAAFATVFGGVGMIALRNNLSMPRAVTWASTLGIIAMLFLTHLVINPLKRAQNTSAVSQDSLIGYTAIVSLAMEAQRFGQVSYSVNSNKYSAPAKSHTGSLIAKGATVTVVAIVKGVFFVDIVEEDGICLQT
ncbi:MAG: DUF1449 family protein [Bacillota bacterium]|nr:DUF1449 family protein [Bacillota bacterium]